jgi:hypothetical protein
MEVFYPDWLANLVLVLKKNNTWCMCIDYTSLNKACPKDPFALPCIDQVIDSIAGCDLLSFLDPYSGYHQIPLYQSEQVKTSFITPYGAYCYITMPFGLKNAGATYQRTMQRCLQGQIGWNMHAYVDDMVVNTKKSGTLLDDLKETFSNLWRYRMKLNPEKCTFRMPAGQLLGFIISQRGIEANPSKSHRGPRAAHPAQRCAEVCWLFGLAQSIRQPALRESHAAVPADEEDIPFRLVPTCRRGLQRPQVRHVHSTNLGSASSVGANAALHCGHSTSH